VIKEKGKKLNILMNKYLDGVLWNSLIIITIFGWNLYNIFNKVKNRV